MLIGLLTLVTASLASFVPVHSNNNQQVQAFKLGFDVHRGDSIHNMAPENMPVVKKRDGSVALEISNQRTFYMATLKIGSNQDEASVLVDTGSSDLWLMSHDVNCVALSSSSSSKRNVVISPFPADELVDANQKSTEHSADEAKNIAGEKACIFFCGSESHTSTVVIGGGHIGGGSSTASQTATNTCTQYGSFDTSNSNSFNFNNSAPEFSIEYGDGTTASGRWGHDSVVVSNVTVHDLSFAIANETDSNIGVLGIGLPGLETTYSSNGLSRYQYENMPLKMRNSGIIAKNAYSLYLGDSSAKSGTVLFGAVDHAKYSGQLYTLPIVNTLRSWGYSDPIRLDIAVDSIVLNATSQVTITSNTYSALLDSGSTLSYFPSSLLERFGETLGGTYSSTLGAYLVQCFDDDSVTVSIDFMGARIEVPLPNLIVNYGSRCFLGVLPQSDSYILFGDNVLRSMYLVYDLEDYEISVAQAKYTDDEDIEVISSAVPNAMRAAGYSSTLINSAVSEGSATTTIRSGSTGSTSRGSQSTSSSTGTKSSDSSSVFDFRSLIYVTGMAITSVIFLL